MLYKNIKTHDIVEAFQYFSDMGTYTYCIPVWFNQACLDGTIIDEVLNGVEFHNGDWMLCDKDGNITSCTPGIFLTAYRKLQVVPASSVR